MDTEPSLAKASSIIDSDLSNAPTEKNLGTDDEDPLGLKRPYVALIGSAIAFCAVGIPILAVLVESPIGVQNRDLITSESDGSKPSVSISF
tara:strand:- start:551 stop:823 length:273 start_codon:yes stop_codon:yes gene_type:complete